MFYVRTAKIDEQPNKKTAKHIVNIYDFLSFFVS